MSINERQRQALFTELDAAIGTDAAEVMMELLPRQPHTELATKADLAATTARLEGAMAELGSELRGEMSDLRGEMSGLRGEMAELRGEMAEIRGEGREMKGELKHDIARLYQWGAGVVVANGVAVVTALVT